MGYLVFARKWRPTVFEDVVGQEHITDTLKRAIEKDRVAHAYIFTGTRGVGKTTTARILARALNCENGPTPNPCGICSTCRAVIAGSSFDVMEIDGASNNGVDSIRDLRDNIGYTSMGGKYRIIIIDEVHMLSTGAFNALLKTLEEPPEKVIFIFATTEPHKIPDTIHSRCQRFDFRAISDEQIGKHLKKICHKEDIAYDEQSIALIAHKAAGSMRDSLSLLDQVYSFCGENLHENQVRSVLGLVSTDVYRETLTAIADGDAARAVRHFEMTLDSGYDIGEFLTGFRDFLRTLLFLSIPGGKSGLAPENEQVYRQAASLFSEGDLLRMSELLAAAERDLRWSTLPRFTVELALVKLASMERTITLASIMEMIKTGNYDNLADLQVRERVPAPIAPTIQYVAQPAPVVDQAVAVSVSPIINPIVVEPVALFSAENPSQVEVAPSQVEVAPSQVEVAPVQVEVAPSQVEVAPVQVEVAPVQVDAFPAQNESLFSETPLFASETVASFRESEEVEMEYGLPVESDEPDHQLQEDLFAMVDPFARTEPIIEPTLPPLVEIAPTIPESLGDDLKDLIEDDAVEADQGGYHATSENDLGEPPVLETLPDVPVEKNESPVNVDILREWSRFLQQFARQKPVLAAWLQLGSVMEVTADSIDIQFVPTYSFQQHELSRSENREIIEREIFQFSGAKLKLHLTVGAKVELTPEQAAAPIEPVTRQTFHQRAIEDEIKREPIIAALIEKFNAEVI